MIHMYRRFLVFTVGGCVALLITSCGSGVAVQPVQPDSTSYPKERINIVMKRATFLETMSAGSMELMNGSVQHDFESKGESSLQWQKTEYGDSATSSVDLPSRPPVVTLGVPGAVFGAGFTVGDRHLTKEQIFALIDVTGQEKCGDDYRASFSRVDVGGYYVRCPIESTWNDSSLVALVNKRSKEIELLDYNYFDIHEKDFQIEIETFWTILKSSLSERGWFRGAQIGIEEEHGDQRLLVTKRHEVGTFMISDVTEQLILAAAPTEDGGTKFAFRLFSYTDAGMKQGRSGIILVPTTRDAAFLQATDFLGFVKQKVDGSSDIPTASDS